MVIKTYISKSNTIIEGSNENFGLNPISMLHYGGMISRFLVYFDTNRIKKFLNENTNDYSQFTHKLVMTNCGSVDVKHFNEKIVGFNSSDERIRASSFDIIAFELPYSWDAGVGFDSSMDFWLSGKSAYSNNGSTWYQSTNTQSWDSKGIFTSNFLTNELHKFNNGEDSIIVAKQHFDYGNENIELDISNYINAVCNGKINNGLCISFAPQLEEEEIETVNYVGFFNNNTNTFFVPYVETKYNSTVRDDRYNFILNRENNLLLFSQIDGKLVNLDKIPTCNIDGKSYTVNQVRKGIYCANVNINSKEYCDNEILSDTWGNIVYNNNTIDDVELEFVTHSNNLHFSIGEVEDVSNKYSVSVQGINDLENIIHGEKREVKVYFKRNYTKTDYKLLSNAQYRIYVIDGNRELDVIKWDNIDLYSDFNIFTIDGDSFIPGKYFVDIKADFGNEIKIYKEVLKFFVENNVKNEKY